MHSYKWLMWKWWPTKLLSFSISLDISPGKFFGGYKLSKMRKWWKNVLVNVLMSKSWTLLFRKIIAVSHPACQACLVRYLFKLWLIRFWLKLKKLLSTIALCNICIKLLLILHKMPLECMGLRWPERHSLASWPWRKRCSHNHFHQRQNHHSQDSYQTIQGLQSW